MTTRKIFNRFDEYEISSVFSQSAEDYLKKSFTAVNTRFWIKCIIGPLLAINAYLSHWGPWPWPSNYNLILFSIFFYYIASYIFAKISVVNHSTGALIGEYVINGTKTMILLAISDDKLDYIIELTNNSQSKVMKKKHFPYYQYFTESGKFLEQQFHKHLGGFIKNG